LAHAMTRGAHIAEIIPCLRYIPAAIAKWKYDALSCFRKHSAMFLSLYHDCVNDKDTVRNDACLAKVLVSHSQLTELEAAWLCGTLVGAGAETVSSSRNKCLAT